MTLSLHCLFMHTIDLVVSLLLPLLLVARCSSLVAQYSILSHAQLLASDELELMAQLTAQLQQTDAADQRSKASANGCAELFRCDFPTQLTT